VALLYVAFLYYSIYILWCLVLLTTQPLWLVLLLLQHPSFAALWSQNLVGKPAEAATRCLLLCRLS
jgi:hypothetical protein